MRVFIVLFIVFAFSSNLISQEIIELAKTKFENVEDYKEGEDIVVKCTDLLYSKPINSDEGERILATRLIYEWIQGTPDYHFILENWISKINDKDPHLMGLYLGGMASFVILNSDQKDNNTTIQEETAIRMIQYIKNKGNKVQKHRQIKKLIFSFENGSLLEYLNISSHDSD